MLTKSFFAGLLAATVALTFHYLLLDDWTEGISPSIATGVALFALVLWSEWKRGRSQPGQPTPEERESAKQSE